MSLRTFLSLLTCLVLLGCGEETTQAVVAEESGRDAVGHYCGMLISEHKGPKGQIVLTGTKPRVWFSSVRDALTYADQEVANEGEIAGFWVNDMSRGTWGEPAEGAWVPAKDAFYVVGSSKGSAMGGNEAVPFAERARAEAFAKEFGGKVVDFATAKREIAAPVAGDDT